MSIAPNTWRCTPPCWPSCPTCAPGLTPAQAQTALLADLDSTLFPGGAKAGWWMKCVQLDLEFKGVIARAPKPPVRLHRVTK